VALSSLLFWVLSGLACSSLCLGGGVVLSLGGSGRFGRAAAVRCLASVAGLPVAVAWSPGVVVLVVGCPASVSARWLAARPWLRALPLGGLFGGGPSGPSPVLPSSPGPVGGPSRGGASLAPASPSPVAPSPVAAPAPLVAPSPPSVPAPLRRAGGGGPAPSGVLPSPLLVARSAFRAGGLAGLCLRPRRSGSSGGWVLVAAFRSSPRGLAFAGRWAGRLGFACRVSAWGSLLRVSVGVRLPRCLPLCVAGRWFLVAGGLAGLGRCLAGLGVAP